MKRLLFILDLPIYIGSLFYVMSSYGHIMHPAIILALGIIAFMAPVWIKGLHKVFVGRKTNFTKEQLKKITNSLNELAGDENAYKIEYIQAFLNDSTIQKQFLKDGKVIMHEVDSNGRVLVVRVPGLNNTYWGQYAAVRQDKK